MMAATIFLGSLGCIAALLLGMAARRFAVTVDPRQIALREVLAGANCGACGYPGCDAYARALVTGTAKPDLCSPGGMETLSRIAAILGVTVTEHQPQVAVVRCQGDRQHALPKYAYQGLRDCRAAQKLALGPKLCPAGCLGLGSCVQRCPFDALTIDARGLAVVDRSRCIGCGLCVTICPRQVLVLAPTTEPIQVLCNSREVAAKIKSYCSLGCLGCRLCVHKAPDCFVMDNSLARVRYGHSQSAAMTEAMAHCPHRCIHNLAGHDDAATLPLPLTPSATEHLTP